MSKLCFLCGEKILEKSTKEHIIGDSFLARFNLKNQTHTFNHGGSVREYSRLKLPAHRKCNGEMGSRFEQQIISLLEAFDDNIDVLGMLHKAKGDETVLAVKRSLVQWLAKIYIGLVYWESEFFGHNNASYQDQLKSQLNYSLLSQLQECFKNEWAFTLPSSLYYFRIQSNNDQLDFDFATGLPLGLIYLKFRNHLLIGCISDGYLTEEWFTDHQYIETQKFLDDNPKDCLVYLHAVAHVWSVRENLPIAPKIDYTADGVADSSRAGLSGKPPISEKIVSKRAAEILEEHRSLKCTIT